MLLVARALLGRPRLMLIDEISEGLQPSVLGRLASVLRAERAETGCSILLVEQNVGFALSVADRFAVLQSGEIVEKGAVGDESASHRILLRLSV
jgi:branched-chain amino acid transport system ATP-binding protein